MDDLKQLFRDNYLQYASYVILDRAIPELIDGLKPVQRRILWTLFKMDDGKLHKVANVAGQTMALHPHGDAAIIDALVNLANKGFLLDRQGNYGNPHTGDPAAAARYIETRLSGLAKETLFNPALTTFVNSYDSRNQEPVALPAKIPLLLMQGSEGIAVGMATKIFPHNFKELLEAEIAHLNGESFTLYPDFPAGGTMDVSDYDAGQGKVKLRARIEIVDDKTLLIKEICHGTTTESLIRSVDDAAKKGRIKIDSISDYTAENVAVEIKLPRGQYAANLIDTLYAFTDCEVTLHAQLLAIKDHMPWEGRVEEVLKQHVELLQGYLKGELEIEKERLLEKIFEKTLEQIFIENRLYKMIEKVASYDQIFKTIDDGLKPFHSKLSRKPTKEDLERLVRIPIRRISLFDINKNQEEIHECEKLLTKVAKNLENIKKYTITYLQGLLTKYGDLFPRRTKVKEIRELDIKEIAKRKVRVGYDESSGFLGMKVSAETMIECTNYDKLLLMYGDGSYKIISIPEKQYIHTQQKPPVWIGVADKTSVFNVIYREQKSQFPYAKRFIIKQFIHEKLYLFLDKDQKLEFLSSREEPKVQIHFKPKARQKVKKVELDMGDVAVKGVSAKGIRIANKELKRVKNIQGAEE